MKRSLAALIVLSGLTALARGAAGVPPCTCLIQPDKTTPIRVASGRAIYCGLDLGSKTAKLSVVSMEPGHNATIKEERQCLQPLGFGAIVFDSKTGTARPLPGGSIQDLTDTIREFAQICAGDGGHIVAAGATQWGRDATNINDVRSRVQATTGVSFDVLTPRQEADFAYVAASAGTPGRIVLDPGSNSFELAWQERGATTITSVLVAHGYVRGATNDIEPAADYAAGRRAYQAGAKTRLETELAALNPPMSLARVRDLVRAGRIGPEMITLGLDGVSAHLAVRGLLRPGGRWVADAATYGVVIGRSSLTMDPSFGVLSAAPMTPAEITAYFDSLGPSDFTALTTEPIRSMYGQRVAVVPALVELLLHELGATRLMMVPQAGSTGHILSKLSR